MSRRARGPDEAASDIVGREMREGTLSIPLRNTASRPASLKPYPGLRLGRYELLLPIAQGGMAEVWAARLVGDLGFSRVVALKTIRSEYAEDPQFRRGFFEEARVAAQLSHAHVVEVLDLGEHGTILFQVMRLIEGDSLARLIRAHQARAGATVLPVRFSVRVVVDALGGLHAAHELADQDGTPLRLVHRDVSPHNILVGLDGVARIGDFGVAKALGRKLEETEVGQIRGKPGYLAPEQALGGEVDRRADVFAAGIVLWEALTGKRLFRSEDGRPHAARVDAGDIPDPRRFRPDTVASRLAEAVMVALARDPRSRFPTAEAFAVALEEAMRGGGGLASDREVAAVVRELCGGRLTEQRLDLCRALHSRAEPFDEFVTRRAEPETLDRQDFQAQLLELVAATPIVDESSASSSAERLHTKDGPGLASAAEGPSRSGASEPSCSGASAPSTPGGLTSSETGVAACRVAGPRRRPSPWVRPSRTALLSAVGLGGVAIALIALAGVLRTASAPQPGAPGLTADARLQVPRAGEVAARVGTSSISALRPAVHPERGARGGRAHGPHRSRAR